MSQSPPRPPFETLDAQYRTQVAAYESAIEASIRQNDPSRIPSLRTQSEAIQATLTSMIETLTFLKKETPDITKERTLLLETLRRIQRDYGAMIDSTDDLETLRRIREQANGETERLIGLYLIALVGVATLLVVYLLYTGSGRKTETTAMRTPTPAINPAFT